MIRNLHTLAGSCTILSIIFPIMQRCCRSKQLLRIYFHCTLPSHWISLHFAKDQDKSFKFFSAWSGQRGPMCLFAAQCNVGQSKMCTFFVLLVVCSCIWFIFTEHCVFGGGFLLLTWHNDNEKVFSNSKRDFSSKLAKVKGHILAQIKTGENVKIHHILFLSVIFSLAMEFW